MSKLKHWVFLVVLVFSFIEILSYGTLYFLRKIHHINYEPVNMLSNEHRDILNRFLKGETKYINYSSTLGWTIKENGTSKLYQANSSGIRSSKEYELKPSTNIFRISTFGDSFTHGDDVGNEATWQAIMERCNNNLEVLNFGVGGYGLDQAYLRYLEDGRQYKSHIILIGFMSENIFRSVNIFRPFYSYGTGIPLTKPRFTIKNGELSLIQNPMNNLKDYSKVLENPEGTLQKIGIYDYFNTDKYKSGMFDWLRTIRIFKILRHRIEDNFSKDNIILNEKYNENSEAFLVTKKIFDEFYDEVLKENSIPIITIFPNIYDMNIYKSKKIKIYSPLISYFNYKGYKYIDIMDIFEHYIESHDINNLFIGHHYSALSNTLVAENIAHYVNTLLSAKCSKVTRVSSWGSNAKNHYELDTLQY